METLCKIREIYQAVAEFERGFEREHSLTLNEAMLLYGLTFSEKMASGEIADYLNLTTSNTSKVLRSVESKGLVARWLGKRDKRQMYFSLTPEGRERIERIGISRSDLPERLREILQ